MNSMVIDEQIEVMENNGPFSCADPAGGQGDRTPPGKSQKYRVP